MGYPPSDDDDAEETVTTQEPDNDNIITDEIRDHGMPLPHENGRPRSAGTKNENEHVFHSQERRASLPAGVIERGHVNSICGQILRYIGDEQYSMACGRHLRSMGDQLCYNYYIRNMVRRSEEFHQNNEQHLNGSHSSPNLNQNGDKNV